MTSNAGTHNPSVIDLVTLNHQAGDVRLIMVQTEPWEGSERQLRQLKEKTRNYISFTRDGQLMKTYPETAGRPVTIQLDVPSEPIDQMAAAIASLKELAKQNGIGFEVNVLP